ncbi:MAG: PAS domain S-box protein [Silicimonas sp.]|nr:PAS domain S-box protein [Silicimonas sp.]
MTVPTTIAAALELAPVPMLAAAENGAILAANPGMEALFGYRSGALIGQQVQALVPSAIHGMQNGPFAGVPDQPRIMRQELAGITVSGEEFPLLLGLNPVTLDGVACTMVSAVDIGPVLAQRKRHETPDVAADTATILTDHTGCIVLANEAALLLTGHNRDELLGKPVEILIPGSERRRHVAHRKSYLASGTGKQMSPGRVISLIDRGGQSIPVQVSLTPVEGEDGRGVICAIVDLREQIAKNRMIEEQNRELVVRNQELTQFAYAISHDLKAPLSSLQGLMALMREDIDAGDTGGLRADLEQALGICERSRKKVERVLHLARDQIDESVGRVRLPELVDTIWNGLLPGVDIVAELVLDILVDEVETSETGLEVILHNLVSNALTYHDPRKDRLVVRIGTAMSAGAFVLQVGDNGVGIDETHRDRVFELFQKLDSRAGDGIGLALVQRHVARLGGIIEMESEPGRGTTFCVRLPLAA